MSFRSEFKSFESTYKVLGVETPLGDTLYRLAGEGIPVVLLPGETGQMAVQYRLFSALASHFQVLTWDWPEGVATMEDALKTVEFLTNALISRSFWLMGAALGGTLGVIFAERYPERVQGLALTKLGFRPFDPSEKESLEAGMDTLLQNLVKLEKLPRQVVLSRMHAQLRRTLLDRPPGEAAYLKNLADALVKTLSVSDAARMARLGVDILWAAMATVRTESGIGILAFGQGDAQDYFSVLLKPGDFVGAVLKRIVEA